MTSPAASVARLAHRPEGTVVAPRRVPEEAAVALSYNGRSHAVMMATPKDLEDFAVGFSLTEGIICSAEEIEEITVEPLEQGIDIQICLKEKANLRLKARHRRLMGPIGCGLCGVESIEEAMRKVPVIATTPLKLTAEEVLQSVRLLAERQQLYKQTGAVHAAGFYVPGQGVVNLREDVGRHNALDKLAGALVRNGIAGISGAIVITSRVSVEMIQKTAVLGSAVLIAVATPMALAVRAAEEARMTLVALVRDSEFDIFTHPERIVIGGSRHVA